MCICIYVYLHAFMHACIIGWMEWLTEWVWDFDYNHDISVVAFLRRIQAKRSDIVSEAGIYIYYWVTKFCINAVTQCVMYFNYEHFFSVRKLIFFIEFKLSHLQNYSSATNRIVICIDPLVSYCVLRISS